MDRFFHVDGVDNGVGYLEHMHWLNQIETAADDRQKRPEGDQGA